MSCWSITAVKPVSSGKTRLAGHLSPQRRAELVAGMLSHVLSVLSRATGVDRVAVVGPERSALPGHVVPLADPGGGLNDALAAAALEARQNGAERLLIVHADLPLLEPEEVTALVEASKASGLALAPDRHGRGTNALCLSWPPAVGFEFGPDSFRRHVAQATARGLSPAVVRLPGLAFDLDEPGDFHCWPGFDQEVVSS
ncbi:MAG: 2-phospho-L-lactate guanylyltransferase [Steroidobacteraceae bacterium]